MFGTLGIQIISNYQYQSILLIIMLEHCKWMYQVFTLNALRKLNNY